MSEDLANFAIVEDSGYPELRHFANDDDEDGCFVMHMDAGDRLSVLLEAARTHRCGGGEDAD